MILHHCDFCGESTETTVIVPLGNRAMFMCPPCVKASGIRRLNYD